MGLSSLFLCECFRCIDVLPLTAHFSPCFAPAPPLPAPAQPFLRFYAGAPIKVTRGGRVYKLGTVCVLDRAPHSAFTVKDKQLLLDVAAMVADEVGA